MAIPDEPQSRIEQYLGVIIDQASAQLPDIPQSRVEEYLAYIVQNLPGLILSASDDPNQKFKITVDSDGKLTTERIA